MLSENLVMLRNLKGLTQEQVAEVVEISRQSYAKWEQGYRFLIPVCLFHWQLQGHCCMVLNTFS